MGVSTTHKNRGDGGKKTTSSSRSRLQVKIDSALSVQRTHVIKKEFRHGFLDGAMRPPSGQKAHGVVERASWMATPSNFAFDQIAGGMLCAAIGTDKKETGEVWSFTFRGEEALLPRQFRLGSKRSRADSSESESASSEDEAPAVEQEEQALVPAAPTPSRKSSKGSRSNNKKIRQDAPAPPPPPAPKKKPRRNEPSRRRGQEEYADNDGDTTETEASHLARTRQHKQGDQILVASTSGGSQAGSSSSSPNRAAEDSQRSGTGSDGEPSLGRGKRITSGPYGRAQKHKTSSSPPRSDKVPRPKQRDTALADPLNAYNHDFETPAFQGRKSDRRAESITGESEVARLCARVDHLGVRSATGGSAPSSVIDADTVRGSPAPTVDMDEPATASSSTAMTRSASKGKSRAL